MNGATGTTGRRNGESAPEVKDERIVVGHAGPRASDRTSDDLAHDVRQDQRFGHVQPDVGDRLHPAQPADAVCRQGADGQGRFIDVREPVDGRAPGCSPLNRR